MKVQITKIVTGCLLVIVAIFLWVLFVPRTGEAEPQIKARLVVDEYEIQDDNIVIYKHGNYHSDLPMLAILKRFGIGVTVLDGGALVVINTDNEEFHLRSCKLYRNSEFLCDIPGYDISTFNGIGEQGELYVEGEKLTQVFSMMGIPNVEISIDPAAKVVSVRLLSAISE